MLSEKTKIFIVIALIVAIGIFYVSTIRQGHGWGDDFSLYIHHAINIADGIAYQNTGYIYNPAFALVGPATYPPGFPLLLTPVYKIFGLNFTAFKIEVIILFLAGLFLVYLLLRDKLGFKYLVVLIALLGLHPFFWSFKDSVLSDIPFFFWCFLAFFLIEKKQRFSAIGLGLVFYLAYATRVVGIVLPACLVCYEFLGQTSKNFLKMFFQYKRGLTPVALAVFASLAIGQAIIFPAVSSYFDQFNAFSYQTVIKSFLISAKALIFFWGSSWPAISLGVVVALLALLGFVYRLKDKKISILEIFLIFYVLIIGIWPANQGIRFLIPIIPLFLFYCFSFLERPGVRPRGIPRGLTPGLLTATILVCYASQYMVADFGPIKEGPFRKESQELFQFVKQNTNPEDVFIFAKPRALALLTERSASVFHETKTDQELWDYFAKISADYLIHPQRVQASHFLDGFVARNQSELAIVYSNADFVVYRIISR